MSYCTNCGKQNPDTAKFCGDCGASIVQEPVKSLVKSKRLIISALIITIISIITFFLFYKKSNPYSKDLLPAGKTNIDDLVGTWQDINSGEYIYLYKQGDQIFRVNESGFEAGIIKVLKIDGDCLISKDIEGGSTRYTKLARIKLQDNSFQEGISFSTGFCLKYNPLKDVIVDGYNHPFVYKRINKENKQFNLDDIIIKRLNIEYPDKNVTK